MNRRFFSSTLLVLVFCANLLGQEEPPPEESLDGTLRWSFRGRGAMVASPALSPDELTIYTASANGTFYALSTEVDEGDGDPLWSIRIPGGTRSSPMVAEDGTIYIGGENGFLYSISDLGTNGVINWRFRTLERIKTSPAMDEDGVIYVASHDGRLYALAPEDGGYGRAWAFQVGESILGSPTIAPDGTIYIVAGLDLIGVSPDGSEAGRFTAAKYAATTPAVAEHGTVYFGANDERVYAVDPAAGTNGIRWRFYTGENVMSSPSIGVNGRVYIGSDNGRVHCFNTNGTLLWRFRTRGPVRSSAAIGADGTIYIGSNDRRLYAITPDGEERWNFRARGIVKSSPCIGSDGTVYFVADRTLYAIWEHTESDLVLDSSPWPMYRRDPQHTARADIGEPFILQQPESVTAMVGDTVEFTVRASAATAVSYQWLFNGVEIDLDDNATATNATLVIRNVSPTNAGSYSVVVSTDFGEVTSDDAQLIIHSAPVILTDLTNHIVSVGSVLTLEVNVVGDQPLMFQWFRNGVLIENAITPQLTITNTEAGVSTYFAIISNALGTNRTQTAQVTTLVLSLARAADTIAAGNQFSAALITNMLFTWGADVTGQLGDGGSASRNVPTRTSGISNWLAVSAGGVGYTQTTNSSAAHAVALLTDGTLYAWGANSRGQVGNGSTNDQQMPVLIGSDTNWMQFEAGAAHTVALQSDGTIWAWGSNEYGQLGIGTTSNSLVPVRVGVDSAWVEVRAGGSFTLARRADNTLWAWGRNESGQLGINSTNNARSPMQVGSDTNWMTIRAGASHSLGLRTDGTLWMWGRDFGVTSGAIHTGTNNTVRIPQQVGAAMNWLRISAGYNHSLAIDSENRLYAWGANNVGQLGNGRTGASSGSTNLENISVPVQIGAGRDWSDVDAGVKHSLARAIDGSIWAWGWNNAGQVGDGTGNGTESRNRNAPVLLTFTNVTGVVTNINPTGAPSITVQPASVQAATGSNSVFTVTATGASPLSYQWRFNSNAIAGATTAQLTVAGVATNGGAYDVVITNSLGAITSAVATLTFSNSAPVITRQPSSRTSIAGGTVIFSVLVAGTPPFGFQWRFNGTAIAGATNSSLNITNVQLTNAGSYSVVITNRFGLATSMPAGLDVDSLPLPGGASLVVPPPTFGPVKVSPEGVTLPVTPTSRKFVLEFKNHLSDPEWTPLRTNEGNVMGTNITDAPSAEPSRFYRIRVQ